MSPVTLIFAILMLAFFVAMLYVAIEPKRSSALLHPKE